MSEEKKSKKITGLNLIESSHHDLGWHKCSYGAEAQFTFEEINQALDLMNLDPKYTWAHECPGYVYQYLKKYPERYEELKKRVLEGRFDIGAGYTMPYTSFVTSEMLARQFIYGKKWVEDTFPGSKSSVYYNTDIPGLGVQMPQLMKKAGVKYLYASRSWNFDGYRTNEFKQFEALDKSRINTYFMKAYGDFTWVHDGVLDIENPPALLEKIKDHEADMESANMGGELPLFYSMDCKMPADFREGMEHWNAYAREHGLPEMNYKSVTDALDAVFTEDAQPEVLSGEWPSKWFYENAASDDHTFMLEREAERFLRTTEVLAVLRAIASHTFANYPAEKLEKAWRAADHSCHGYAPEGSIEDFKRVYQEAFDTAKEIYEENLNWLVGAVRTVFGKGMAIVAFNSLSWVRSDHVVLPVPENPGKAFRIVDVDGNEIPYQLSDSGEIVFVAENVPAMGYRVYYLRRDEAPAAAEAPFEVGKTWTEAFSSPFYTVTPVSFGGALESVIDRENQNKSLFSTEKFKIGELMDFRYDGMGAGEQLNMWQPHHGVSQLGYFTAWKCVESGPVRTVFETQAHASARGPVSLRLTVYEALKRLDFDVKMDLDDEASRQLRLMFPVNTGDMFGADGMVDQSKVRVSYEVPFGTVNIGDEMLPKFSSFNENTGDPNNVGNYFSDPADFNANSAVRPREVQNWIQASDTEKDVSVMLSSYNLGWDYQDATDRPCRTPVLQPVMISTSKACHWLYGHWLQPGEHAFHFSLTSGTAGSTAGHRTLVGVNNPLDARFQSQSTRLLPETGTGVLVNRDNVVISAMKKAEDDNEHVVIRWYEAEGSGEHKDVTITLPDAEAEAVQKVSLIERPEETCPCCWKADGSITGPVAPWSVETAMVTLKDLK